MQTHTSVSAITSGIKESLKNVVPSRNCKSRHIFQRSIKFIFWLGILVMSLDQIVKFLVVHFLKGKTVEITDFFALSYTENTGIAFGIPFSGRAMLITTILLICIFFFVLLKHINLESHATILGSSLIFGGAISNMIDRFRLGYVIDFIKMGTWPTFNLADACITIGAMIVILFHKKVFKCLSEKRDFVTKLQ